MEGDEITRDSSLPAPGVVIDNSTPNPSESYIGKDINFDEVIIGKEIKDTLNEIEKTSKISSLEFSKLSKEFEEKNDNFIKEINQNMKYKISKYNEMFKLSEKPSQNEENSSSDKAFKTVVGKEIQLIKKISEIYCQIYDTVKQNFEIMSNFLKISKRLNEIKPIQDFLSEEFNNIVKSWLFMKIDFEKFDFNAALNKCDIDSNFKNFITKVCKDKNFIMRIIRPKFEALDPNEQKKLQEKKQVEIKLLNDNKANLVKLRMENVGTVNSYLDDKIEFVKLKNFYIENSTIQSGKLFQKMPNLLKLTIKSCPNFDVGLIENIPLNIKKLYLEKNNFVNQDIQNIMKGLFSNNKNILENLELLSFAGNNLTKVDLTTLNLKTKFQSLTEMNFQKNKIYKFIFNPDNFPSLKFINCCKNNFNKSYLSEIKGLSSLESGNGFLFEPELCDKYYGKLKTLLTSNKEDIYRMNYLNITYMPAPKSLQYFSDFNMSEQIMIHLKKLDLSYNGLDCNTFFKFVSQNKGFINLRSLNLNGNEIDDTFFEKFPKQEVFSKLQHLYLNSNRIGDTNVVVSYEDNIPIDGKYSEKKDKKLIYKLRLIYQFIQSNKYLTKLTITKNPICEFYSVVPEPKNDADRSDKYIKKDENGNIIINCLFSLLIKIRDELLTRDEEKIGRNTFNLRFDCRSNVNKNSDNYPYSDKPIIYKSK